MIAGQPRISLMVDLENLISAIKNQSKIGIGDYGTQADIDFEALLRFIEKQFGAVSKEDFVVAANFSHYNQQLGGLNRLATLIHVDSFDSREVRSKQQHSPGKRYVIPNYSDMALAFLAGAHIAAEPADIYIFVTGDAAFAAVASLIQERYKRQVHFILPDENKAAAVLKERFLCIPFSETQPAPATRQEHSGAIPDLEDGSGQPPDNPNTERIRNAVAQLRLEFHTAIPSALIRCLLGPAVAQQQLDRARTEEVIDLWTDEDQNEFISPQTERLYGKVVKMPTRIGLLQASNLLFAVAQIAEQEAERPVSRSDWRKRLKQTLQISNAESKKWLDLLFTAGILRDEHIQRPDLTLDSIISFIHKAEATLSPSRNLS